MAAGKGNIEVSHELFAPRPTIMATSELARMLTAFFESKTRLETLDGVVDIFVVASVGARMSTG